MTFTYEDTSKIICIQPTSSSQNLKELIPVIEKKIFQKVCEEFDPS